ncbi:MAG TPA: protein kinase, partial [Thermoleophilaceae bacterium]|nr:protein kinase [Thermoleophilaceae bacterium]
MSDHTSTKAPPRRRRAPTEVAGHRLLRPLEGSHATWEIASDNPKRIKLLVLGRARKGQERAARTAFHRQLRARASLLHPHLAAIVDGGESPRGPYVVVSLPKSRTLSSIIAEAPLDPARTHALLTGVADALDAAHARWLIHTDLTPRAVFVEPGPRDWAFLTDFGIAHNRPPLAFARAGYRSPEELRGEAPLPESNVYSLACIVYTCLAGTAPFSRQSSRAAMQAQLHEDAPRLTEQRPELPAAIDDVLARALSKTPDERQRSAGVMVREVGEALGVIEKDPASGRRNGSGRFRRRGPAEPAPAPRRVSIPAGATVQRRPEPAARHAASASTVTPAIRPKPTRPSKPVRRTTPIEALPPRPRRTGKPRAAPPAVFAMLLVLAVAGAGAGGWVVGDTERNPDPAVDRAAVAKQRAAAERAQAAAETEERRLAFLGSFSDAAESLNARRAADRRRLAQATTPGDQSARARRLAGSYTLARRALADAPKSVPGAARLGAALRRAEN